jgi:hypothetical protein
MSEAMREAAAEAGPPAVMTAEQSRDLAPAGAAALAAAQAYAREALAPETLRATLLQRFPAWVALGRVRTGRDPFTMPGQPSCRSN